MTPPEGVERDAALARLTTIRTGGPADYLARPATEEALVELLAWAAADAVPVAVVGSGSNLLVADEGFRGLVVKLEGTLAEITREGERLVCGGGTRLPSAAAKAAGGGLAGIEFGINIPGTVGGAVRMNANAYGGELARTLEWVTICTAAGLERRAPAELGLRYRGSELSTSEIVSRASFQLSAGDPTAIKAAMSRMRDLRHEAQPSGIKTFGSTFTNPDAAAAAGRTAGQLLADAGCNGLQVGGTRLAEKHANFVENTGTGTTAEVIELMTKARLRVFERSGVVLEPEVQVLGDVIWPHAWATLNTESRPKP